MWNLWARCLAKTTQAQWRKGVEWGRREEISWR